MKVIRRLAGHAYLTRHTQTTFHMMRFGSAIPSQGCILDSSFLTRPALVAFCVAATPRQKVWNQLLPCFSAGRDAQTDRVSTDRRQRALTLHSRPVGGDVCANLAGCGDGVCRHILRVLLPPWPDAGDLGDSWQRWQRWTRLVVLSPCHGARWRRM